MTGKEEQEGEIRVLLWRKGCFVFFSSLSTSTKKPSVFCVVSFCIPRNPPGHYNISARSAALVFIAV